MLLDQFVALAPDVIGVQEIHEANVDRWVPRS